MGINSINQSRNIYFTQLKEQNNYNTNLNLDNVLFASNKLTKDVFNGKTSLPKDGKDDGSIGFDSALSNMIKGVGNFFKGMFCDENGNFSVKQTLTTVGIGVAIGATCAFMPAITIAGSAFSTMGLISGGFLGFSALHLADSFINVLNADTDDDAEKAWQGVGSSLTETTLSFVGYKTSGGVFAKDSVKTTPTFSSDSKLTPKSEPVVKEPVTQIVEQPKAPVVKEPVTQIVEQPKAPVVKEPVTQIVEQPKAPAVKEPVTQIVEQPKAPAVEEPVTQIVEQPKAPAVEEPVAQIVEQPKMTYEEQIQSLWTIPEEHNTVVSTAEQPKAPVVEKPATVDPQMEETVKLLKQFEITDDSAVLTHHSLNSMNSDVRDIMRTKNLTELLEEFGYREIRTILSKIVKTDAEFEKLPPLEHEQVVYRGRAYNRIRKNCNGDFKIVENAKVGDVIVPDEGYSYTGFDSSVLNGYGSSSNGILYEIRLPKGAKVSRNSEHWIAHKGEAVMPRGAKYKVLYKNVDKNGLTNIVMEYILPTKNNFEESQALLAQLQNMVK